MPEWIDDTRRTSFSKSTKQGKYELTKTEAANTGPSWICAKSSTIYYNCGFNILWGSWLDMNVSLIILPLLRHFSFCCDAMFNFLMEVFVSLYYIVSCHVWLLALEACCFGLKERKSVFNGERNLTRIGIRRGRTN